MTLVGETPRPVVATAPAPDARALEAPAPPVPKILKVGEGMTPKELAEKMSATPSDVIKRLIKLGVLVTINTPIGQEEKLAKLESHLETA